MALEIDMLFFWWRKYEYSWIATAASFIGTIVVTLGSIVLAGVLAALASGYIENETIVSVVGVIAAIGIFVALKALLNKLTDIINDKHMRASYEVGKRSRDRKTAKQMAIINEGIKQKKIFNIIKERSFTDEDMAIAGVKKLTDQSLLKSLIESFAVRFPARTKDSHIHRIMMEAINQIKDDNTRNSLRKRYELEK